MKRIEEQTKKISFCLGIFSMGLIIASQVGCAGKQGPAGESIVGPQGATGATGATGSSCTVTSVSGSIAPNGGSLISCQDGTQSLVLNGATGPQGETGATGPQGLAGQNGGDGTAVTAVQFCPSNFVPSYPNVFVKFGFCVGGQLYAVYSANGGFLTLLPPGSYSSDGINASCTFTIELNCIVSR